MMLGAEAYFDLKEFKHKNVFEGTEFVWEAIGNLKNYIENTISPNLSWLGGVAIKDSKKCGDPKQPLSEEDFDLLLMDVPCDILIGDEEPPLDAVREIAIGEQFLPLLCLQANVIYVYDTSAAVQ